MEASRREAVVVVVESDGQVLIIQRAPSVSGGGHWAPLSGRIEPGESQAEAVVRETREEVGINVRPLRRVWECPTWDETTWLHWWLAEYVDGDIALAPDEVSEARWMTVQEFLSGERTFEGDRRFFEHVFPEVLK